MFKVIQGHQFRYQWKARVCDFLCLNNSNLPPSLHRFRDTRIAYYWFSFRYFKGRLLFNAVVRGDPKFRITKFGLKKLKTFLYRMM